MSEVSLGNLPNYVLDWFGRPAKLTRKGGTYTMTGTRRSLSFKAQNVEFARYALRNHVQHKAGIKDGRIDRWRR